MVEFEADDALATAVTRFKGRPGVEQIVICSPDKDMAQCVSDSSVVGWDRRRDIVLDEQGVIEKFGVRPHSIPDWLALVGDAADGYPGIPQWGAKSASTVLFRFEHLESIPPDPAALGLPPARAAKLIENLESRREEALLYRLLATLRTDVPLTEELEDLQWRGARPAMKEVCRELGDEAILERLPRWRD
jgi:5'-3' exonuclease